ncbi:MAG: BON domain-containing protein [Gammaproteobacteria bacterium]|nr:BON domain-containing protein [Gammaproteobacteria bacterium]
MKIGKQLILISLIPILLSGCTAAVVGAGAVAGTTASVAHDRRTTGTFIEDQAIELKAIKSFFSDKEIHDSSHLNVTSYNTVVLITGETPSEDIRQRIVNIVKTIPKVTHVYDELTIAAPSSWTSRSSDSLITSKVKTKLLTLKNFDGTRVKVVTEKGVVYLMGLLTRAESDVATRETQQTGGVQKVVKLFQYVD